MGWKPDEFWHCTPSFFFQCYIGYRESENTRLELSMRLSRLIAYYAVDPHNRPKRITDIFEMPGDFVKQWPKIDPEALARFNAQADEALKELQEKRNAK